MSKRETSWETDSPVFSINDPISKLTSLPPYHASEDKKGHGVNLQAWFPKSYSRRVEVIRTASRGIYSTTSDVIRDAIHLGMHVLELRFSCDPEWQLDAQLDIISSIAAHDAYIHDRESNFVDSLERLVTNKEEDRAIELLQARFSIINRQSGTAKCRESLIESLRKRRLTHLLEKCKVGPLE